MEGNFLLSLPNMGDQNFRSSIVYVSKHSGDGAKGWVVNKEVEGRIAVKLRKSIQLGVVCPLYYGGPVDVTQVYVLHSSETQIVETAQNNAMTIGQLFLHDFKRGNLFPRKNLRNI